MQQDQELERKKNLVHVPHLDIPDRRDADGGDDPVGEGGGLVPDDVQSARVDLFGGLYGGASVQRRGGHGAAPPTSGALVPSGGRAIPDELREKMESRFGSDFSGVRIHVDDGATEALGAEAYTVGSDIVFSSSTWSPDSAAGQHLIAHELTHVIQQSRGPVAGDDIGGGVSVSDPSDAFEQEAEATASRVSAGGDAGVGGGSSFSGGESSVQRKSAWDGAWGRLKQVLNNPFSPACDAADKAIEYGGKGADMLGVRDKVDGLINKVPESVREALGINKQMLCGEHGLFDAAKDAAVAGGQSILGGEGLGAAAKAAGSAGLNSLATNDKGAFQGIAIDGQMSLEKTHGALVGDKTIAEKLKDGELTSAQAGAAKKDVETVEKASGDPCGVTEQDIKAAAVRNPGTGAELDRIAKTCDPAAAETGANESTPGDTNTSSTDEDAEAARKKREEEEQGG